LEYLRTVASQDQKTSVEQIGTSGILLTERTLLTTNDGNPVTRPLSFSSVPADGIGLDESMKLYFAKHFQFFHSVPMSLSKEGSTKVMRSMNELLTHFMVDNGRATLLAMLALSTGHMTM
jgi:hypothetical protein